MIGEAIQSDTLKALVSQHAIREAVVGRVAGDDAKWTLSIRLAHERALRGGFDVNSEILVSLPACIDAPWPLQGVSAVGAMYSSAVFESIQYDLCDR